MRVQAKGDLVLEQQRHRARGEADLPVAMVVLAVAVVALAVGMVVLAVGGVVLRVVMLMLVGPSGAWRGYEANESHQSNGSKRRDGPCFGAATAFTLIFSHFHTINAS